MGLVNKTAFLTGATGFLGTQIARRLLAETDASLIVLVRGEDHEAAVRRLSRAWWAWPQLAQAVGGRITMVQGDIRSPRLGLDEATYEDVARRATWIVHAAADIRLRAPLEELRRTNVGGTSEVLALARAAHAEHGLDRFSHLSTAYVASRARDVVSETDCDGPSDAPPYEQSKWEGERLVHQASASLPVSILRPGMVVGDSVTGAIKTFNTVYAPIRLYLSGKLRVIPASSSVRVNLVPVDYVAQAAVRLTLDERASGLTFHLTAPWDQLPTYREFTDAIRSWARSSLGLKLPRLLYLPVPWPRGAGQGRGVLGLLQTLAPYLDDRRRFLRENTDRLLGSYPLEWRGFLPQLLEYAVACGFFHRSDRTVHEQFLFRLAGKSRPVTYHDMAHGRKRTRTANAVRAEALQAAAALGAMGIRKGDRVAWVGHNSTRLLSLDVAIGLVGAVSVPLYYTSPPEEIDEILADSKASLLLVGAPGVLARLDELSSPIPVVSFCRTERLPETPGRRIETWETFLARGGEPPDTLQAPVDFGDLATLRYTSGTTGRPKGIPFHHGNLRFMAESLVSLVPWRARTRRISMLSFLPMNHVVEGILTTYSPYYAPASLDLHFLEDFRALAGALPHVRPTFFFSVPRFYERVWSQVLATPMLGGIARGQGGRLGGLLRRAAGRLVLRRSGLDRCVQLLVGSAPARADVLDGLSGLGIRVHNAYGLTEAPLVTMTRVGRSRAGTVGEPLPQTEIRIAPDGEILVRGPQVTPEALHNGRNLGVASGWLATGDLGVLDPAGHLVISGRKKELIVTAYGKNVSPGKVEALLHSVPGVREVMLVGDGEAYCAALLWMDDERMDQDRASPVDCAVEAVNRRLSHPERVKAWALLPYSLSIEGGELTANLKLRRREVLVRYTGTIDALYQRGPVPSEVRHIGRAEKET
jgi:long-chain acyl-CoA synthetase